MCKSPLALRCIQQRVHDYFVVLEFKADRITGVVDPVVNIPEQSAGLVLKVSVVCLVLVIQQGLFISTTITIGIAVAP